MIIFTLEDDLGNETEFELLDVINYKNDEYAVLIENVEDVEDLTILKIDSYDDQEEIIPVLMTMIWYRKSLIFSRKIIPDEFDYK